MLLTGATKWNWLSVTFQLVFQNPVKHYTHTHIYIDIASSYCIVGMFYEYALFKHLAEKSLANE